jgi:plasmid stabilization system protein ParE
MDQDTLRKQLAKLHAELDQAHQNNPAARERLSELLPEIKRMADQPQSGVADASLPGRLEKVAVQFEADHPTLAASARRLVELLGEVGI